MESLNKDKGATMTQKLVQTEEMLQGEIEEKQKAEATTIDAEPLQVEAEQQTTQIEVRLMEEQEAREEAEKRAAEAKAQRELKPREQLDAQLEVEKTREVEEIKMGNPVEDETQIQLETEEETGKEKAKGKPETQKETADVESLRGRITNKDAYESVLITIPVPPATQRKEVDVRQIDEQKGKEV